MSIAPMITALSLAAAETLLPSAALAEPVDVVEYAEALAVRNELMTRLIVANGNDYDVFRVEEIRHGALPAGYAGYAASFASRAVADSLLPADWYKSVLVSAQPLMRAPKKISHTAIALTTDQLATQQQELDQLFADHEALMIGYCTLRPQEVAFACASFDRLRTNESDPIAIMRAANDQSQQLMEATRLVVCNSTPRQVQQLKEMLHGSDIAVSTYCQTEDEVDPSVADASRAKASSLFSQIQYEIAADPVAVSKLCAQTGADESENSRYLCYYWRLAQLDGRKASAWTAWGKALKPGQKGYGSLAVHSWQKEPQIDGEPGVLNTDFDEISADFVGSRDFNRSRYDSDTVLMTNVMPAYYAVYVKGNAADRTIAADLLSGLDLGFDALPKQKGKVEPSLLSELRALAIGVGRLNAQDANFPIAHESFCMDAGDKVLSCRVRRSALEAQYLREAQP